MLAYMNIVGALINADDTVMNSYIVGVPPGGEGAYLEYITCLSLD